MQRSMLCGAFATTGRNVKTGSTTFLRSVIVLFSGTFLAQLISVICTPVISRYFGPEENAYLGLFLRITTLGATLFTARLELVLPIEKKQHYAFGLYQFSFRLSFILSLLCLVLLLFYSLFVSNTAEESWFLLSLPLGIFIISFFNLGSSWELRQENYRTISRASISLSLVSNALKIAGGIFSRHYLVLIGATLLGYLLACVSFVRNYSSARKGRLLTHRSKRTRLLVKGNKDFYTYNLFHVLVDLTRDMLIASFLWIWFSRKDFGSFEFAFRMLKLPTVILGVAMSQVFFRKAQYMATASDGFRKMTLKTMFYSLLISLLPFGIIMFYGEPIFSFVFGPNWVYAGKIAGIISPWLFMYFFLTPLSFIPILFKKQKTFFWLNVINLFIFLFFGLLAFVYELSFESGLQLLTALQTVHFLVVLLWYFYLLYSENRQTAGA